MTRVESYPDGAGPGGAGGGGTGCGGAGGVAAWPWGPPAVLMTRVTPSAGLCDCATSVPSGPAPGVEVTGGEVSGVEVSGVEVPGVDGTGSVVSSAVLESPRSSARDTCCVGSDGDGPGSGAAPGGT